MKSPVTAPCGSVTAMTMGNYLIEATTFNNRLQTTQIRLGTAASPSSALQLDYTYGVRVNNVLDVTKNNGNVERQTISCTGLNAQQTYTYDELNRLKTMSEAGGWSQTYSYDRFGNRWVSGGNVPSPQQTPQTQSSFDALTNRINPAVMAGFGYDSVGNLTSDPTTPANGIVYDAENRQTGYTKSGVGATTYSYDGDGRRVKKVTGSPVVITIYVYDVMGRLVAEYNDVQQQPAGGTKYLTADHLGTTRVVTGQNQGVTTRYDYLPYGEEIGAGVGARTVPMGYSGSDTTRQKFTSKERDSESGLDYFGARYYSGTQGRFTSADPLLASQDADNPQSWNRFSYSNNSPIVYIDIGGLYVWGDGTGGNKRDKDLTEQERKNRDAFRNALTEIAKSRDSYDKKASEYARLNNILTAYGAEGARGVTIRFDTKGPRGQQLRGDGLTGGLFVPLRNNKVGTNLIVTFSPTAGLTQTAAHEGQHVRDLQSLAAHAEYIKGKITVSDQYNPTTYTFEDRAFEAEQFIDQALKVDQSGAFQGKTYYLYKTSWAEADRKTLMSNMQAARDEIIREGYKVTKQSPGPRQVD